jgi:hypothetical protein
MGGWGALSNDALVNLIPEVTHGTERVNKNMYLVCVWTDVEVSNSSVNNDILTCRQHITQREHELGILTL